MVGEWWLCVVGRWLLMVDVFLAVGRWLLVVVSRLLLVVWC